MTVTTYAYESSVLVPEWDGQAALYAYESSTFVLEWAGQAATYAYESTTLNPAPPADGRAVAYLYENQISEAQPNELFIWDPDVNDYVRLPTTYVWNGTVWSVVL